MEAEVWVPDDQCGQDVLGRLVTSLSAGARPQFSVRYMKHYLCNSSSFLNSHQKASVSTEALNIDILIKPVSVLEAHTEVSLQHHVYSVTRSF